MGKYDVEYSKYYNSIENKSKNQKRYTNMNSGYINNRYKRNKKRSVIKETVEYSIFQCILTFILLVTILAMKYSNDNKSINVYNDFRENVNEKSSYSEIVEDISNLKFSEVKNTAIKCLNWIRENIDEAQIEK